MFVDVDTKKHNDLLSVKETGNIITIVSTSTFSKGGTIKKLSKDYYVNTQTGELKTFNHKDRRIDDIKSIKLSMAKLRDIINANITEPQNCLWVTLTYKENMTDTVQLYKDFDKFNKKIKYHYEHKGYIVCVEPQGRGAWHMHAIFLFDSKPYIPNNELANLWKHGFTQTKSLKNVDNVGAYLSAYLSDIETENLNAEDNTITKKILKGGRLSLYPKGMHFYRTSKGLKKPTKYRLSNYSFYERFLKTEKLKPYQITYTKTKTYKSETFSNTIKWTVYNTKKEPTTEELLYTYGATQINNDIF